MTEHRGEGFRRERKPPLEVGDEERPFLEIQLQLPALQHLADPVRAVQYLKDGMLASVSVSGHMILWDPRAAAPVAEFHLSDRLATCVAISPDGRRVAAGSSDGKLSLFDTVKVSAGVTVGG